MSDPATQTAAAVWVVEALARALRLAIDPLEVRRHARDTHSLVEAGGAVGLSIEQAGLEGPLPLATLGSAENGWRPALIRDRQGSRVLVERPEGEPAWVDAASLPLDLQWVSAVVSAPLHDLAHHPSPGQRAWQLLRLEGDEVKVVALYAAVVGLLTVATPIAVQALVGSVAFGAVALQPLVVLSLLLLVALTFQAVLQALQTRLVESIQERLFVRTAMDLAWRLPRVTREEVDHGFGAETVNRFFDVVTLQKTASALLTDGIATILQVAIGVLVLAFYHPTLLAFAVVLVGSLMVVVGVPWQRGLATSVEESAAKYGVAAWLQTVASSTAAFRGAGGAQFAVERADALTRRYLDARRRHFVVLFGQTAGVLGLVVIASALVLGLGGWLVVQRELTLGQLVAAELIVAAITSSLAKSPKLLDHSYDLLTSLDKLGHLLDLPIEAEVRGEQIPGAGAIPVEVHRAREGDHAPISLAVTAGARLAMVGTERSALAEWLAGLRLPDSGSVVLNGVETSRARTPLLREHVALIAGGDLFEGTVLENVLVGRPSVTTAEARAALEQVGLLDHLRSLPEGLDTPLAHTGAPLTPSEVVQVLVARALAGTPRLIVVNLPLDVLDPARRQRCVAALTRADAPWTLVAMVPDASVALAQACEQVRSLDSFIDQGNTP